MARNPTHTAPDGERPRWWWTVVTLVVGWLLATLVFIGLAFALWPLRVDLSAVLGEATKPAEPTLWWSVAHWFPHLLYLALLAFSLRVAVEWAGEWKLRFMPLLALAGAGALLFPDQADDGVEAWFGGSLLAFGALVFVTREYALVPERTPWRPTRAVVVALAAGTALLLAATLSYRPLHPLGVQVGVRPMTGASGTSFGFSPHRPQEVPFGIVNDSFAAATIVSSDVMADGWAVEVQFDRGLPANAPSPRSVHSAVDGTRIGAGEHVEGRIRLAPGTCGSRLAHRTRVSELTLVVETLGITRTQRFAVRPAAVLRCPSR